MESVARAPKGDPDAYPVKVVVGGELVSRWRYSIEMPSVNGKRRRITGTGRNPVDAEKRAWKNFRRYEGPSPRETPENAVEPRTVAIRRNNAPANMTFERYTRDIWLPSLYRQSDTVKHNYLASLRIYIFPRIGRQQMKHINKSMLIQLFAEIRSIKKKTGEPKLGESAIKNIYTPLALIFKRAVEVDDIYLISPLLSELMPRKSAVGKTKDTSPEIVETFTNEMMEMVKTSLAEKDAFYILWLQLMLRGMRQGERNGLIWEDVYGLDSETAEPYIKIQRQLVYEPGKGNYVKNKLKTNESNRIIPVDPQLKQYFVNFRKQRLEWIESGNWQQPAGENFNRLVFTTPTGEPLKQKKDTALWHAYRDRHGFGYARQHLARHATATLLYRLGVPIGEAQLLLGHNSPEISQHYTAKTYKSIVGTMNNYSRLASSGMALEAWRKQESNYF